MSLSCLQTRSYPFLGRKYSFNDLYSTHRPPLCRVLLAAQFCRRYRGRCRLPTPPLYCATIRLYQTWQAMRKLDKAWCVAFKFCTRPDYLASGLQKVGPEPSSSLLSLSTKGFATFIMMEQYLFSCFYYPFAHLCDMTQNANWFVLQFSCCPQQK